ncbi:MAG: lipopolysaccharide heptosyltransferase II [Candidatus Omnitrophica bacterium]|nr:lipopolysaccharide heptosyltransferase II [Candidatus Omnitrophota bacterium]
MSFRKILLINPYGIGDVLFTTPVVGNLRKSYPQAFIGYIANRRALPVVESNPKINHVYVYERDEFKDDFVRRWVSLFQDIRRQKFDVVFDFSLNASFGFLSMICGISKRIGYDYRGRGWLLTDKIRLEGYEAKHVVEYYLDLLTKLDVPVQDRSLEFLIDQQHQQWAKDWIKTKGISSNQPIIALIPGGGASWGKDASQKRWPAGQYALLVDKIIAKSNSAVILMGDQKEQLLCQEFARRCSYPVFDAVGGTTLLQMAALLQQCRLAIVNDGGPLHVAVACGVKTVSIFGPVDPVVYGPYPSSGHIFIQKGLPCQPCYRQFRRAACNHISCLRDLSVDEVYDKVERFLVD